MFLKRIIWNDVNGNLTFLVSYNKDNIKYPLYSAQALLEYPQNSRVPLEHMIVEVIFGEMFRLPVSEYLQVCYGSILIELCKKQPTVIPQVNLFWQLLFR